MELRRGERGIDAGIQGDHGRTYHQVRSLEAEIQAEEPGWISLRLTRGGLGALMQMKSNLYCTPIQEIKEEYGKCLRRTLSSSSGLRRALESKSTRKTGRKK
jgi:hypothetical protein